MLELTEMVVVKGVTPYTIIKLLGYSIPFLLSLTIPMSTLLATLLAFLRLSGDNEITVLKSAGVSLYQLLPPVFLFSLWTYLLTSYLSVTVVPAANGAFRNELLALAKARAEVSIKERIFNEDFKNMVLYINHIPIGSNIMYSVFIQDDRDEEMVNVVLATRGRIATDKKQRHLIMQLFDGVVDRVNRDLKTSETIDYDRYDLKLDLESELAKENLMKPDQYEMSTDALWKAIDEFKQEDIHHHLYSLEVHKRFALPFACIVLGLIAVPLGIMFRLTGRNWGIVLGLIVFLVYYILHSAGWSFGESGAYPPALGMWMPNIIIGLAAIWLLRQANRQATPNLTALLDFFNRWLHLRRREKGS
jgi:lipopolysaccharide export system permease protein